MARNRLIVGKKVILDELQPKYFEDIIKWRNDLELNRYLNQPYKLTMEMQIKWYEEKYLNDMTQGLFVMLDKINNVPFGTIGWTDMDVVKKMAMPKNSKTLSDAKIAHIATLKASGYTNAQIAKKLGVSTSTIIKYLNE